MTSGSTVCGSWWVFPASTSPFGHVVRVPAWCQVRLWVRRAAALKGLPVTGATGAWGGTAKCESWVLSCWLCVCGPVVIF